MLKICIAGMAASLFSICMSAVAVAAPVPPDTVQSYDSYGSWLVACDNTLSCVVKGFNDSDQGAEIKIERQAGSDGTLTVSISADQAFTLTAVTIDGEPASLPAASWQLATADGETSATSDDLDAIRSLVQRLRNASKVTLGGHDIPLDGFTAALLRADERQGRIGGVTALLRAGPKSPADVLKPMPLPMIPYHPISQQLVAGEDVRLVSAVRSSQTSAFEKEDCEIGLSTPEPEAHALDSRLALVLIPCLQGAYQSSLLAFIAPRDLGPARRLIAPTPYIGNDTTQSDATIFTEVSFDPKLGVLSTAARGRAMADCGSSASWIWDGRKFQLSELTLQNSCGGLAPGDWPTLFRSKH